MKKEFMSPEEKMMAKNSKIWYLYYNLRSESRYVYREPFSEQLLENDYLGYYFSREYSSPLESRLFLTQKVTSLIE